MELKLFPYPYKVEFLSDKFYDFNYEINFEELSDFSRQNIMFNQVDDISKYGKEEYTLEVAESGIFISYATYAGKLYALITLDQLCKNYHKKLPQVRIFDKPRYDFRGFMFDSGRYFFPINVVKKFIDLCAFHKINAFHWHLTEDQGWRLEIEKYPLLTKIGSKRKKTNFKPFAHSGYYTKVQIKELIAYAKVRNIQIIPEIDVPGHSVSALASYPYLGCFDRKLNVASSWGVKFDVLCVGKDTTLEFYKNILDEVCDMFESDFIHIGGDEVPTLRWQNCPHCTKKLKDLGLNTYQELQSWFMGELSKHIFAKNKKPIMWNEYELTNNSYPDVVWQLWHYSDKKNLNDIIKEIKKDKFLLYSSSRECYLDNPICNIDLKTAYNTDKMIPDVGDKLLGVECCLWTELVPSYKNALKKSLPRLTAISESMWSAPNNKNYDRFLADENTIIDYLKSKGYKSKSFKYATNNKAKNLFDKLWFERRQLYWSGLYNLIDNKRVKKLYKK